MTAQQLKNSILQMAVQGKLVPQDPNDEPASVLLERIKAEKEALIKSGKIKKSKKSSEIFRGASRTLPYAFCEQINKEIRDISDEIPFEIPESWEWSYLSFITYSVGNKSNQVLSKNTKENGIVPVVSQSQNLIDGYSDEIEKKIDDLPLVMFGDHTRNVKYIDFSFVIGADGTKFHKILQCSTKYIYFWMLYSSINLKNRGYARHYSLLTALYIPIPPLAEQKRIVAKIEELLPFIEKYEQAETKLTALNKSFPEMLKKSILQEAVQGKLVPQNPDDEPASVLLERIRAEKQELIRQGKIKKSKHESIIVTGDKIPYEIIDGKERCIADEVPFEIPESWEWCRWGNLSESIQYGFNAPAKESGRIKMVRISDIQDNKVLWESVPYCDIDDKNIETYLLEPNDILFTRTGGTVGKSYLVKDVPEKSIYAGYLIRTRYSNSLCPEYLKFFMESELYWIQIRNNTIATAQPNCNGKTLSNMLLPIPPLAEQKRIVKKINELMPIINSI